MEFSIQNENNINLNNSPNTNTSALNNNHKFIEKDSNALRIENNELKENNAQLLEQIKELERKLEVSNIKLEKNDILNFEVLLTEREIKIKKLKEKEEKLNKHIEETKITVDILEAQFQNDNLFFKESVLESNKNVHSDQNNNTNINSNLILEYQNCLLRNIKNKEEAKRKHKVLLEKLLILAKNYKELTLDNENEFLK